MPSSDQPSPQEVQEATYRLARRLITRRHVILSVVVHAKLLGPLRTTSDVDFVVPMNGTSSVRKILRTAPGFQVEARTLHTRFKSARPVEIEILTPPVLFKETFDERTEAITLENVRVLKPALLLNAKCKSFTGRSSTAQRRLRYRKYQLSH